MKYDYFLICPVRTTTPEEQGRIRRWVAEREADGKRVYWPARDTDQGDSVGTAICHANRAGIEQAAVVAVWWSPVSRGSLFDLGIAWALRKPIELVNIVPMTDGKSFSNVLRAWEHGGQTG